MELVSFLAPSIMGDIQNLSSFGELKTTYRYISLCCVYVPGIYHVSITLYQVSTIHRRCGCCLVIPEGMWHLPQATTALPHPTCACCWIMTAVNQPHSGQDYFYFQASVQVAASVSPAVKLIVFPVVVDPFLLFWRNRVPRFLCILQPIRTRTRYSRYATAK